MADEFWGNPENFTISPTEVDSAPSGIRNPYLTLFARVDASFNGLVEELSSIDGVEIAPFESYHLTVKQIGEFGDEQVTDLVDSIRDVADQSEPITVSLEGVDVFPNCVYIPVQSCGELTELHQDLCCLSYLEEGAFEGGNYIPHVTVAKFVDSDVDRAEVASVLESYRETEWFEIEVETLHLVKDKPVNTPEIFPPFESIGEFSLENSSEEEDAE